MTKSKPIFEEVPIESIRPHPGKKRIYSLAKINATARNIKPLRRDLRYALLIDTNRQVLGRCIRNYHAARLLRWDMVIVIHFDVLWEATVS